MGFGKLHLSCSSANSKRGGASDEEELRLGSVICTLGILSNESDDFDSAIEVPLLKRQCSERMAMMMMMMMLALDDDFHEKSSLESLPRDVLIRVICEVEHKDLKQLYNVSKSNREAVSIELAGLTQIYAKFS